MRKAKKQPGTGLVSLKDLEAAMAVDAATAALLEPTAGVPSININKKKFMFQETVLPNPLKVVVVTQVFANALYNDIYDPDQASAPVCSAVGLNEAELKPDPKGPGKMNVESCAVCPNNAFGSAERGRGKACRNGRKLAVLFAADLEKNPNPSYAVLSISPAGLAAWSKYVKGLARLENRAPYGVVTHFTFDEEQNSPVVVPIQYDRIDEVALLSKIMAKKKEIEESGELVRPFDMTPREVANKRGKAKVAAKRGKVAKKKAKY